MLDRVTVVDDNFIKFVREQNFPTAHSLTTLDNVGLSSEVFLDLFHSQCLCRHIDIKSRRLKEQGLSFYTIASSGHEANAVFGKVFKYTDMAFLHYRSGAMMLQRAKQISNSNQVCDQLLSIMASTDCPIAGGRHKVFGSVELNVPPQTSTIASHLPKAIGAALSITRAKELKLQSLLPNDSVIICSFGDGSVNHSTAQGAFNTAQWLAYNHFPLPIVFICEDNGLGISVPTPTGWIEASMSKREGIEYIACDGMNLADVYGAAMQAANIARLKHQPVFLHMKCERLLGHAGSDIELHYKTEEQIAANEFQDPLLHTARICYEQGLLSLKDIIRQYEKARIKVDIEAEEIFNTPKLTSSDDVCASLIPPKRHTQKVKSSRQLEITAPRNLCRNINMVLQETLDAYPNAIMFGEDIAKKGGVYQVTAGLQKTFGQRRVFDSLLDEQSILGMAIGLAHNGFVPIPEIQYLAYLHNAEDQLRGEAATLSYFSKGQYTNPMVLRIPGLAYQKGFGGHFHNDNSIAVIRDIPGVIIACPVNGTQAVKLLRRCMQLADEEQRIVIFLEPVALYMMKDLHEHDDKGWLCEFPANDEIAEVDQLNVYGDGNDCVIVTYGNGFYLSRQAEKILSEQHQMHVKVIDLQWLSPLPVDALIHEVKDYDNILIVDEGRKTGSISEELMAHFVEHGLGHKNIKRLTGDDVFIPLGDAWKYVLPSTEKIVEMVL